MSLKLALLLALLAASAGIGFGYLLRLLISLGKKGSLELDIKQMELSSKEEARRIISEAEARGEEITQKVQKEFKEREERIKKTEDRLAKREEFLDGHALDLNKEAENVKKKNAEISSLRERASALIKARQVELSKVAGLSHAEAKNELLNTTQKEAEEDLLIRMQKLETEGEKKLEGRAKEILSTVIQRLAVSTASAMMGTTISLPSDELKGKIIGKEGRNIKAFERATGVEVIVDDTPNSITLSSFDPVRRAVAKFALDGLIADGRIQPAKIEEFVAKAEAEVNKIIKEKGEAAAVECEIYNLDPKLLAILGRLHFRTSYSQNVRSEE